jgi:hypothetical protein
MKLADPADYTALSYSWLLSGDESDEPPKRDINISAKGHTASIPIFYNLYTFFQSVRHSTESLTLWIDALCIDQNDHSTEKASFVPMMDAIYRSAARTIIWLGEAFEDSDLAMDTVQNYRPMSLANFDELDPLDPKWVALRKLLRRHWWSRLWVLQEALLSRDPIIRCGDREVDMDKFVALGCTEENFAIEHIQRFGGLHLFNIGCPLSECFLYWAHDKARLLGPSRGKGLNLHEWFSWSMRFQCREPLDRVYALLGLIDPEERALITVEYSDDPRLSARVFSQAMITGFVKRGLTTLHHGYVLERSGLGIDIPSWVSDWSRHEHIISLYSWPKAEDERGEYPPSPLASHDFWARTSHATAWSQTGDMHQGKDGCCLLDLRTLRLGLKALIVDEIVYHSACPHVPTYGGLELEKYEEARQEREEVTEQASLEWEVAVDRRPTSAYDEAPGGRYEAFWRTLLCDRTFDWQGRPEPSSKYAEMFEIWMRRSQSSLSRSERKQAMFPFYTAAITRSVGRGFAITASGRFSLAPARARVGDVFCLLKGGTVPFVLRRGESEGSWEFLGESYVHGVMSGELLDDASADDVQEIWLS